MHFGAKLYIVVAVYAQNLFHNVAWACDVYTICRYAQAKCVGVVGIALHIDFKGTQDGDDQLVGDALAYKRLAIIKREFHLGLFYGGGIFVGHVAADFSAGKFFDKHCGQFCGVDCDVGVSATLVAE